MNIEELRKDLIEKGFKEELQDTGIKYSISDNHIELICYIEPGVEVEFISFYRWNRNDVKGTYNLSVDDIKRTKDTPRTLFKKTKNNIPEHIGENINVHKEIDEFMDNLF